MLTIKMTTKTVKQENKLQITKPNKKQYETKKETKKNNETKQKSQNKTKLTRKVDSPKKNVTVKKSKSKTKPTYIGGYENELTKNFREKLQKLTQTRNTCSYVVVIFIKKFLHDITLPQKQYTDDIKNTFLKDNFESITIARYQEKDSDDESSCMLVQEIISANDIGTLKQINNLTAAIDYYELFGYKLKSGIVENLNNCSYSEYSASTKFETTLQDTCPVSSAL